MLLLGIAATSGVLIVLWRSRRRRVVSTINSRGSIVTDRAGGGKVIEITEDTTQLQQQELTTQYGSVTPNKGAAGHAGNLVKDGFFFKKEVMDRFENELAFLQRLAEGDPMGPFAPEFLGVETIDDLRYLKMRHFMLSFDEASLCQMDVKMGVRCFAEKELASRKPRKDLFERLKRMDASVLTPEEIKLGSITKARWMQLRDGLSSTTSLGFRVDGVITPSSRREAFGDLASVRAEDDVVQALRSFVRVGGGPAAADVCRQVLSRLGGLEDALRRSSLFRESELIGSSLLFAADGRGRVGVWMLDFGLTCKAPTGPLQHDVPWVLGNHEDGYLTGLVNLRRLWQRLLDENTWLQ